MEASEVYPHFVVTCDYRRRDAPMVVARYACDDTQDVWMHSGRSRVRVEYLDGNARGWWHRHEHGGLKPSERPRVHYEMFCGASVTPRCPVRPFRTDADELQNPFATLLVAGSRKMLFHNGFRQGHRPQDHRHPRRSTDRAGTAERSAAAPIVTRC